MYEDLSVKAGSTLFDELACSTDKSSDFQTRLLWKTLGPDIADVLEHLIQTPRVTPAAEPWGMLSQG